MPIDLAGLQLALLYTSDNSTVELTDSRPGASTGNGRRVRPIEGCPQCSKVETLRVLGKMLQERYGSSICARAIRACGLDSAEAYDRPLLSRHVTQVIDRAETLLQRSQEPGTGTARPADVSVQLAIELRRSVRNGYVSRFILKGDPGCFHCMSDAAFLRVVRCFNTTMDDLHSRFPRLAEIKPPNLSQGDCWKEEPGTRGVYLTDTATMLLCDLSDDELDALYDRARDFAGFTPSGSGQQSTILHEYGHHLSSPFTTDLPHWASRLVAILRREGLVGSDAEIDDPNPPDDAFAISVGKNVREMGMGLDAGENILEFAASALAWRMTPGYAASSTTPRMPRYLEAWLHECFPFTRDGPIPAGWVEFDRAKIKEPILVDGVLRSVERGDPPRRMPGPRP